MEISKVTGPKFTGHVSPNAEGIAVDQVLERFHPSSFILSGDICCRTLKLFEIKPNFAWFGP